MSIPVLVEVYDEMRRLAIAGSAVAPGDFRLKKLIPPLAKSGEKSPVFAKVAQAVQAVVDSNEKSASNSLLELTTLVNAILYTQGETGKAGEFKALETVDLGQQATQTSARVLKPLLEALSSTGSGRLELIRDAIERGAFKDLRLVKPALNAIDDPYPEIGQLIANKVLPLYGKAITPELRKTLDIKGRGGHLYRLKLLHRLDPEGSRDLVQQVLAEGSKEMKVEAIECLGTEQSDLAYVMEQVKAKAKDVRAAALRALTSFAGTVGGALTTLKKAIDGDDLELIIPRIQRSASAEIKDYVLQQADAQLVLTLKCKDKKEQGVAVARLLRLVSCLEDRTDAKAEAFLLGCLEKRDAISAIKSEPSGGDLNELIATILAHGTPAMQQRLVAVHGTLNGEMLSSALFAARASLSPAAFYEEFRPLLNGVTDKRAKKESSERGKVLVNSLAWAGDSRSYRRSWMETPHFDRTPTKLPELDPRWLDAAVEAGSIEVVCGLARPGHAATNKFLAAQLAAAKDEHQARQILRTMAHIGHPDAVDAVVEAIKKQAKATTYYYQGYYFSSIVAELPRSALPKLEALLPTLPDKFADGLMDAVIALKDKPE